MKSVQFTKLLHNIDIYLLQQYYSLKFPLDCSCKDKEKILLSIIILNRFSSVSNFSYYQQIVHILIKNEKIFKYTNYGIVCREGN